jgi:hypothetical protein
MVNQSLKVNYVSVTCKSGFTKILLHLVFPYPEKKGVVYNTNTFENIFDDFVGPIKCLSITHVLLASE